MVLKEQGACRQSQVPPCVCTSGALSPATNTSIKKLRTETKMLAKIACTYNSDFICRRLPIRTYFCNVASDLWPVTCINW